MGKKAATKRNGSTSEPTKSDPADSSKYGFSYFRNEGPMFWIRQFFGLFMVVLGTTVLATSYTENYWFLPIDPEWGPYLSLAVIIVGGIVHEFRPWKRLEAIRAMVNEQNKDAQRKKAE